MDPSAAYGGRTYPRAFASNAVLFRKPGSSRDGCTMQVACHGRGVLAAMAHVPASVPTCSIPRKGHTTEGGY